MISSASVYAQTQPAPKKVKAVKIKPPNVKLTPAAKALKKANDKNNKLQRQAFEKQKKQQAKALKKAAKQARR